jgi:pyridoxine kinase
LTPRHILSISSQVAFGPVGNTAAAPALHAAGFTVLQVPTIILSNHPALGKPAGVRLPAPEIAAILTKIGPMASCVGVMTGYFASADQVAAAALAIRSMKQMTPSLFVLVDPVIGDGESLYVGEDVAHAIRDELMPLSNCLTPNRFELSWLSGHSVSSRMEAENAASRITCKEILATSIPDEDDMILTLAITQEGTAEAASPRMDGVPHGTGDFLAGLYLGARLNGYAPPEALNLSSAILANAIARSLGQATLDVIGALHGT